MLKHPILSLTPATSPYPSRLYPRVLSLRHSSGTEDGIPPFDLADFFGPRAQWCVPPLSWHILAAISPLECRHGPWILVLRLYEQFNLPAKFRIASFGSRDGKCPRARYGREDEEEFYNLRGEEYFPLSETGAREKKSSPRLKPGNWLRPSFRMISP